MKQEGKIRSFFVKNKKAVIICGSIMCVLMIVYIMDAFYCRAEYHHTMQKFFAAMENADEAALETLFEGGDVTFADYMIGESFDAVSRKNSDSALADAMIAELKNY